MFDKNKSGKPAEIKKLPDGNYEIFNDLGGRLDLTGVGSREKDKIYPILVVAQYCRDESLRFVRIKPEDVGDNFQLYKTKKGVSLTIKNGKIIKIFN